MDCLAEILVLLVVRIVSLDSLAALFIEFLLDTAVTLDFFVSELDGAEHYILGNFVHLTFYHHDVLFCCCNHELEISLLHFRESRVDHELAVDAAYANL